MENLMANDFLTQSNRTRRGENRGGRRNPSARETEWL